MVRKLESGINRVSVPDFDPLGLEFLRHRPSSYRFDRHEVIGATSIGHALLGSWSSGGGWLEILTVTSGRIARGRVAVGVVG